MSLDMPAIKEAFIQAYFGLDGVIGVGIGGPDTLRVYVENRGDGAGLPRVFLGAKVHVEITGPIVAAESAK